MKPYQRKPEPMEAQQIKESDFTWDLPCDCHIKGVTYNPSCKTVTVSTHYGPMHALVGSWIIKWPNGELSICLNELFIAIYEEVK